MSLLRESDWEFDTSNSGGLAISIFAAEGGSVTLKKRKDGTKIKLRYAATGAGLSWGVKLPKLGRAIIPGVTGSSESFKSGGTVYLSPQHSGTDLTVADFNGGCMFGEAGGGVAWGGAGYAMVFGMNPAAMAAGAFNSIAAQYAFETASGYLFYYGMNYGIQAGAGVTGFMGMMRAVAE
jgi:hypothetical protein